MDLCSSPGQRPTYTQQVGGELYVHAQRLGFISGDEFAVDLQTIVVRNFNRRECGSGPLWANINSCRL